MSADERLAQAIALRESGELEQALPLLLELREERPEDPQIAVQTAWVHDSLGLEEEAVPHYEAALAAGLPDDQAQGAYLGLGSTLRTLGRDAESGRVSVRGSSAFQTSGRCASSTRCSSTTSAGRARRSAR